MAAGEGFGLASPGIVQSGAGRTGHLGKCLVCHVDKFFSSPNETKLKADHRDQDQLGVEIARYKNDDDAS
jgi:hypothetical protein